MRIVCALNVVNGPRGFELDGLGFASMDRKNQRRVDTPIDLGSLYEKERIGIGE